MCAPCSDRKLTGSTEYRKKMAGMRYRPRSSFEFDTNWNDGSGGPRSGCTSVGITFTKYSYDFSSPPVSSSARLHLVPPLSGASAVAMPSDSSARVSPNQRSLMT